MYVKPEHAHLNIEKTEASWAFKEEIMRSAKNWLANEASSKFSNQSKSTWANGSKFKIPVFWENGLVIPPKNGCVEN